MANLTDTPTPGAVAVATLFGLGRIPRIRGTVGSLVAALLFLALAHLLPGKSLLFAYLIWLGVLFPVSVWTAQAACRFFNNPDPPAVVIDEVVGQHLGLFPLALEGAFKWKMWLLAIILFRAFDIGKPFPLRRVERLPHGWGVVADDLLAGAYTAALLVVFQAYAS